jgi:septal ring factor EnvC (AmiA/AmiB activator)
MATKKPAVSTQLKQAQARIAELEKKVESAERSQKYAQEARADAERELSQLHAFFDVLPGALPKKNEQTYVDHSAMTRLAAWLASK